MGCGCLMLFMGFFGLYVWHQVFRNPPTPQPQQTSVAEQQPEPVNLPTVTAEELWQDYQVNQVAADNKYKDRIYLIAGTIGSIKKDISGSPYITLRTKNYGGDIWDEGVVCYVPINRLTPEKQQKVLDLTATLRPGNYIPKLRCKIDGQGIMGNVSAHMVGKKK